MYFVKKKANYPFKNISKVLEGSKNKKEVENDLLSIMAPLNDESCNNHMLFQSRLKVIFTL